jgi:hypothetical protein
MNTYAAFYKDRQTEVKADTSYHAQLAAIEVFRSNMRGGRIKPHMVTVLLTKTADGKEVVHNGAEL